ncbi:MAG: transcriptional regulator [Acidobacteria bacterium]|nr:transcriptional regulator [Acidobacteriota bacterium]
MRFTRSRILALVFTLTLLACGLPAWTQNVAGARWTPIGPDGGDARSLSYDPENPDHILLGTSSGDLFSTADAGASWSRIAHLGAEDDMVLDHIIFSPQNHAIYLAAWSIDDNQRGDLFRSRDGGRTWTILPGLHNKSIRSFVIAPSDPATMIVGALDGVFRSNDAGETWNRISPEGHAEIHNIESLAIDPRNPDIIYAGTWHLPWKTEDGGRTWRSMKQGLIDDSDIFSIIVDHSNPATVFLSACSGIYKSENAGGLFHKIQGIPFSARRTRMLHQDPQQAGVVYAGTTEGLWRTSDAGATWKRVTPANVIVNDISVDPRDPARVLLATDRSGVLLSTNSTVSFTPSNRGFVHRQVTALAEDPEDPSTVFVGVVNDKEYGGVFLTHDGGAHWQQRSSGLGGRDIFVLRAVAGGTILGGTNNGIFELQKNGSEWHPINDVVIERRITVKLPRPGSKAKTLTRVENTRSTIVGHVNDIRIAGNTWYAATAQGVLVSDNAGKSWHGGPVLGNRGFVSVAAAGHVVSAATLNAVFVSTDSAATWQEAALPEKVHAIRSITVAPDSTLWVAAREGAYRSSDAGQNWQRVMNGLPAHNLIAITANSEGRHMVATTGADLVYESSDGGVTWRATNTGWNIRIVTLNSGRVLAATAFDGIVTQAGAESLAVASSGSRR